MSLQGQRSLGSLRLTENVILSKAKNLPLIEAKALNHAERFEFDKRME